MQAEEVIDILMGLGVNLQAEGENLVMVPGSRVPPGLVPEIRQRKQEILALLRREAVEPQGSYRQVYAGDGPGADELAEMERRVDQEGYVLCWAEVLEDFIAFHRDDVDPGAIPPDFVPYSLAELARLFREDREPLSVNALRLLHEAKKAGARVTGDYSDESDEAQGS